MRSMKRDKRNALATFHDTFDIRRTMFAEHQRKLREARQQDISQQQSAEVAVSSSMAELMVPSTPECDSASLPEVCHG